MYRKRLIRQMMFAAIILMLMGVVGCEATGLGMSFSESVVVAALVGSPALVAVRDSVRRWLWPKVTEETSDKEIMDLVEMFRQDVDRWENEGGWVSPWE